MKQIDYQGQYFAICRDADGVECVVTGDEVLIVPLLDNGNVLLTWEPSAAFDTQTLILPGGETAPGRSHEETAQLELQEEIGYKAGRLDFLGELHPFSKYLTVRSFVYLARHLTPSWLVGDEGYEIGQEPVALADFESLIEQGILHDARVIAGLFLARNFVERERVSD